MKSLAVSCPRVLQLANRYSGFRGSNGVFRGICGVNGGVGMGSPQEMAPVGRFYFSKKNKSTKRNKSVLDFGGLTPRDASGFADGGLNEAAGDQVLRENENQLNKLGTIHVTQASTKSEQRKAPADEPQHPIIDVHDLPAGETWSLPRVSDRNPTADLKSRKRLVFSESKSRLKVVDESETEPEFTKEIA